MSRADELMVQVLVTYKDNPVDGALSPLGFFALSSAKAAINDALAEFGVSAGQAVGDIATQVMSSAQINLQSLLESAASNALSEGAASVAEAIPIINVFANIVFGLLDAAKGQEEAQAQFMSQACFGSPEITPSGMQGAVPADILGIYPGGDVPAVVEIFQHLEDKAINDPQTMKAILIYHPGVERPKGIPGHIRKQLKAMRQSIEQARNHSYDAGRSVFPVYLDLIVSQFRNGNMNWKYLKTVHRQASELSSDVNCADVNPKTWAQFKSIVQQWEHSSYPVYGQDKAELAGLLKRSIHGPAIHLKAPELSDVLELPQASSVPLHSLKARPMPDDINEILQMIVDAAHGEFAQEEESVSGGCGCQSVGAPTDKSVIIWNQGVPSGINVLGKQHFSPHAKAIAHGFDPQPDPPGFVGTDFNGEELNHSYGYVPGETFDYKNDNNLPVYGTTYGCDNYDGYSLEDLVPLEEDYDY